LKGQRKNLRKTSSTNSYNINGGVSSPKARHSPEQLTKLDSYNQGVLPFRELDDISKVNKNIYIYIFCLLFVKYKILKLI